MSRQSRTSSATPPGTPSMAGASKKVAVITAKMSVPENGGPPVAA
nr:hypothetical protein [Streptomyces sp. JUS-F4]